MKLINKTNLKEDLLRKFIQEVAKREMVPLKHATFTIIYRRISCHGTYIGGSAYLGMPPRIKIKIPKDVPINKTELGYVISHELCHSQGLRHRQMKNSIYSRRYARKHGEEWEKHYLWANNLPLEIQPAVKIIKPTPDQTIRLKLDRCLKMVNKWYIKAKISQTLLKKWKQKSNYYEKIHKNKNFDRTCIFISDYSGTVCIFRLLSEQALE